MVLCYLCPGAPEGSTGSGLILKRLRRWSHGLKLQPATPSLQGIGLSPTTWRLAIFLNYCLWPCPLARASTGRVSLLFCGFYVQELPNRQWL